LNAGGESREEFGMRRRIEASLKTGKARSRTGDRLKLNPVECVSGDEEVPRFEGRRSIRQKKDPAFWSLEDEVRFWEPPPGIEDPGSQRELKAFPSEVLLDWCGVWCAGRGLFTARVHALFLKSAVDRLGRLAAHDPGQLGVPD
jgi:hypothetical protein